MKNAYWLDDDGDLAHGSSDNYRTVAEFMADVAEDERLLIVHRVNVHNEMLAALEYIDAVIGGQGAPIDPDELIELVITGQGLIDIRAALRSARGAS